MPHRMGASSLVRVAHAVRDLFPDDVAVAVTDPTAPSGDLFAEEATAVEKAVKHRQREFAAGRRAVRRAMAELGVPVQPVPSGKDRAPKWPKGLIGSISHTSNCCVACLTSTDRFQSLGVDLEGSDALEASLLDIVCGPEEQAWLKQQRLSERGRLAKLMFSAKESAYKCQYPLTGQILDFAAFSVALDVTSDSFTATFTQTVGGFREGHQLTGKHLACEGLILTGLAIDHWTGVQSQVLTN